MSPLDDIKYILFLSGYVGYLMTGKCNLLNHSRIFLQKQLVTCMKNKRIKCIITTNSVCEPATIQVQTVTVSSLEEGVLLLIKGTRLDTETPTEGEFSVDICDVEILGE